MVEEIRRRLTEFAMRWSLYSGSERAEAQTFLNDLFTCFGTSRRDVARFEDPQRGRFLDLIWDRVCIVEMKRPSESGNLAAHRQQALDYWRASADPDRNMPAPRYVVLCSFRRFEVWEPGAYPNGPRIEFDLLDLPDQVDALLFLAGGGREPVFVATQEAVTREAVAHITSLYRGLSERRAAGSDVLRDFVLQCVWSMFAEDLGQIEGHLFTRIVEELIADTRRSSADDLGGLFGWLNRPGPRPAGGLYRDTRYVNGGLFEHPAHVHLDVAELEQLHAACGFDWKRVEPHIFGSLLEGALGRESQWALGAHYTHEVDIQKVVLPSIVEPWRERIENARTLAEVQYLQQQLLNYVVLDPACGSGNFLYVAYRELRRLEKRLYDRERELRRSRGLRDQTGLSAFYSLANIRGIEINPFAVALARVTLWMAHKLAVDELDLTEPTLPLEHLSGIRAGDALRLAWPSCDVIIGNPPFHGDRNLRGILGDEYVEWLRREFGCGIKDHCVYWFRKAHDHLRPGQHAGLVGTNSIRDHRARSASLDYVLANDGVIIDAVSSQDWPGAANVDVSIVNWVKQPPQEPVRVRLDGAEVSGRITAGLRTDDDEFELARPLAANAGRAFFGPIPGASGFVISEQTAHELLAEGEEWRAIVRPYLDGRDLLTRPDQSPRRWIIDFGSRTLEEAMRFAKALTIVRAEVKPAREKVRRKAYRENWWRFSEPLVAMRAALAGLDRYIVCPAQGKRIFFCWADAWTCPSNLVTVFAFDDDYAMGILNSGAHAAWMYEAQRALLEDRPRYMPSKVFATFPWPQADAGQRAAIAGHAVDLVRRRRELCMETGVGLTVLYNAVEDGAHRELVRLEEQLDRAVGEAYGLPWLVVSDRTLLARALLDRALTITRGELSYEPFAYLDGPSPASG